MIKIILLVTIIAAVYFCIRLARERAIKIVLYNDFDDRTNKELIELIYFIYNINRSLKISLLLLILSFVIVNVHLVAAVGNAGLFEYIFRAYKLIANLSLGIIVGNTIWIIIYSPRAVKMIFTKNMKNKF